MLLLKIILVIVILVILVLWYNAFSNSIFSNIMLLVIVYNKVFCLFICSFSDWEPTLTLLVIVILVILCF